jgi:hypothetical protein
MGCDGKTDYTFSQNSDTSAPSGRELYLLQFSLQMASLETFGYTIVQCVCVCVCVCVILDINIYTRLIIFRRNGMITSGKHCSVRIFPLRTLSKYAALFVQVEVLCVLTPSSAEDGGSMDLRNIDILP